jgi:pyrimidine-specific ribonucleoside hydrolase
MKKKIIMDCDPGIDDALAIIMALASEKLEVMAVTTVAGNQTQEKILKNAKNILKLCEREDITIAAGNDRPLLQELFIADEIHGESGLGGVFLEESNMEISELKAWDLMAKLVRENEGEITLVGTGPLTNIALFIRTYPELLDKIKGICIMGGACFGGNVTPHAEFNIYVDPEAAAVVFGSGIKVVMCGLDVTLKAQLCREEIEKISEIGNKTGKVVAELMDYYIDAINRFFQADKEYIEGAHLHDPCTIAYLEDESIFTSKDCNVEIELNGKFTRGSTVVDYSHITGKPLNATVVFDLNREKLINLLMDSVRKHK